MRNKVAFCQLKIFFKRETLQLLFIGAYALVSLSTWVNIKAVPKAKFTYFLSLSTHFSSSGLLWTRKLWQVYRRMWEGCRNRTWKSSWLHPDSKVTVFCNFFLSIFLKENTFYTYMIPETLWVLKIKLLFERIFRNVKLSVGRLSKGFLDHNKDSNFLHAPTETKQWTRDVLNYLTIYILNVITKSNEEKTFSCMNPQVTFLISLLFLCYNFFFNFTMYRALARAGKAYLKKDDDESALRYLNKSLSEHRTPEISKLILEVSVT